MVVIYTSQRGARFYTFEELQAIYFVSGEGASDCIWLVP
jgi:hypothetical protein